ncbi:MAG TPA: hypothetical protein VEI54_09420 [Candidatus Limnocylindrales bacterium]|nr:hypothetical protein [Candidatus Limnocylindrales bacterium]
MQCKELEAVLEQEGLSPLPLEARQHLAGCASCRDLLADLSAIAVTAKRIPAEANPPDRIWVSLRAQLEAEGVIREPQIVENVVAEPWWQGFAQSFRPRVLATVAAGLFLVVGSVYVARHMGSSNSAQNPLPPKSTESVKVTAPVPSKESSVAPRKDSAGQTQATRVLTPPAPQPRESNNELKPPPSENAYFSDSATILSQTEDALPRRQLANNAAVDASLRQNLRILNEFIAECEARLKQNPQDQLTREYLNMAYQQKAELLTAMMDNGRSEQ